MLAINRLKSGRNKSEAAQYLYSFVIILINFYKLITVKSLAQMVGTTGLSGLLVLCLAALERSTARGAATEIKITARENHTNLNHARQSVKNP